MKPLKKVNLQEIKQYLDDNPQIKTAVYFGLRVVGLYFTENHFQHSLRQLEGSINFVQH
jgi:hypothetical protein